jgi:hypothetical protein
MTNSTNRAQHITKIGEIFKLITYGQNICFVFHLYRSHIAYYYLSTVLSASNAIIQGDS